MQLTNRAPSTACGSRTVTGATSDAAGRIIALLHIGVWSRAYRRLVEVVATGGPLSGLTPLKSLRAYVE